MSRTTDFDAIAYECSPAGFLAIRATVREWAIAHPGAKLLDVGAGANPLLDEAFVGRHNLDYAILDIDRRELDKAPPSFRRIQADISAADLRLHDAFDLVCSMDLAEHLADPETFHRNVLGLVRPGGRAVHLFPTFYSLPFVVNRVVPEGVVRSVLLRLQPDRQQEGLHPKFPALYRWCRGPTRRQLRRFTRLGYEVERYVGYFGHGYYTAVPLLDRLEQRKARLLAEHPVPALTSYALVVLRRPETSGAEVCGPPRRAKRRARRGPGKRPARASSIAWLMRSLKRSLLKLVA
jgi:2-polyprenyl-3-methyl-5-hydroxy-6-metoxy-1,4-benzoquinol methylase